jgi:hypothetical protein
MSRQHCLEIKITMNPDGEIIGMEEMIKVMKKSGVSVEINAELLLQKRVEREINEWLEKPYAKAKKHALIPAIRTEDGKGVGHITIETIKGGN